MKKSLKTSYLENPKDLRTEIWLQGSQPLRVPWHHPTTVKRISNFVKIFKILGFRRFLKNLENCRISYTKRIWLFIYGGQNRNTWEALTASQYWVANFKLGELNTEFKLEKILTIAIYDIA